jgi:hypothetical protein
MVTNTNLEKYLASELVEILSKAAVGVLPTIPPSSDFCMSLELFLPRLLRADFPEWENESLDAVYIAWARKNGEAEIELYGTCILISDQTIAPFRTSIRVSETGDSIASCHLMLGERSKENLPISGPVCTSPESTYFIRSITDRIAQIRWSFEVRYFPEKSG